ncbi:MAG: hypothetical protein IPH44_26875 [Myxococcales bacterium]|nr:hypothetical protein [Myxococcales bacterium]
MTRTAGAPMVLVAVVVAVGCGRGDDKPKPTDRPATASGSAPGTAASNPASAADVPVPNLTPNDLVAGGTPTLVVGTLGDDAADRAIVIQAGRVRELFPGAAIVPDTSIDVAAGPAGWPPNPILYGGAHVNAVIAALDAELPLHVDATQIVVGGATYAGAGDRVIAVIPAAPSYPAFLLYAGTGTPGVAEINAIRHGGEPLLLADVHGRLQTGTWGRGADGKVTATLAARARRIAWRSVERAVAGAAVRVAFPAQLAAAPDEAAVVDAIARGVARAAARLQVAAPPALTIYVYPDRRSKETLTGDKGDGHADLAGAALHVIRFDPAPDGGLERLMVHEATHVITGRLWGPAGSGLLGEGIAVWASGQYGGRSLADWQRTLGDRPPVAALLPMKAFRSKPEADTYPLGGLLVTVAIEQVGLAAVRDHLLGATAETWADACIAAGTTASALDAALAARR